MSTLNTIVQGMNDLMKAHLASDVYIESFVVAQEKEYEANLAKIEFKVMQEAGTLGDYLYLKEEAGNGLVANIKAAIDKVIEAFLKFCQDVKVKFLTMLTSKETDETIKSVEKKAKFNPFVGKKKVEKVDEKKKLACVKWAQLQYTKLISKIKAGKKVEHEEIDEVFDEYEKMLKKASGAAIIVVPVLMAVAAVSALGKSMKSQIDEQQKITDNILKELKNLDYEQIGASVASDARYISNRVSRLGREAINLLLDAWTSTLANIRRAVASVKGTKDTVTESSEYDNLETDSYYYSEKKKASEEDEESEEGDGESEEADASEEAPKPKKKKGAKKKSEESEEEDGEAVEESFLDAFERDHFGGADYYSESNDDEDDTPSEASKAMSYLDSILNL